MEDVRGGAVFKHAADTSPLNVSTITGVCGPLTHKHAVLIRGNTFKQSCLKSVRQLDQRKIILQWCEARSSKGKSRQTEPELMNVQDHQRQ